MIPSTKPLSDKTGQRLFCTQQRTENPPVSPCEGLCTGFVPRGGETTRLRPEKAKFGPVWARLKKSRIRASGEMKRVAGERVWVGKPPHTRLTAPGRAGRFGLFPRGQFPSFSGSVLEPWVRLWVRNQENPGIPGENPWVRPWVWPQNPDGRNV